LSSTIKCIVHEQVQDTIRIVGRTIIRRPIDDIAMTNPTENNQELDPVRARLLIAVRENGASLSGLSGSLGKNPAYLQQFVKRGSPRKLPEDIRHQLAGLLDIDEAELGGLSHSKTVAVPEPLSSAHRKRLRGFAARLTSARLKSGHYSQTRFASKAEIALARYVELERGDDDPTIAELDSISAMTGISLNWLVKG
jgi:DNA-binding XRE family transcriptional regulator